MVLARKCEDQAFKLFGSTGPRVLNAVVCALDHDGIYSMRRSQACLLITPTDPRDTEDAEISLETNQQHLNCSYDTRDTNLISISKGYWVSERFFLETMLPVDWSNSCWTHTLQHGIIASLDFLIPQEPSCLPHFRLHFSWLRSARLYVVKTAGISSEA